MEPEEKVFTSKMNQNGGRITDNPVDSLDDSFAFHNSSPQSLRQSPSARTTSHDYNFSGSKYEDEEEDAYITEDGETEESLVAKPPAIKQCTSSRSSISSFPASVIHNSMLYSDHDDQLRATTKSPSLNHYSDRSRSNTPVHKSLSPGRDYLTGFRNPSSVLAMQMRESDFEDSDHLTPGHCRRGSRISYFSHSGSIRSSPTKRSNRSTPTSPRKSSSKLKREFPLVLLHCTLLPPAVATHGPLVTEEILEAVLPEEYRERWKTLQEKVNKNSEVKLRGVLIPHPKDDYELLEERLLESLELQRPRIRQNHYLGQDGSGTDSGFESSSQTDEDEERRTACEKCEDCGKDRSRNVEQERQWEIKVFAANGLMRAGAWGAAWAEMEKVDVEVGVWMPKEVRQEVDVRLAALQSKAEEDLLAEEIRNEELKRGRSPEQDERMREIYGDSKTKRQDEIDGLEEAVVPEYQPEQISTPSVQIDLTTLVQTRIRMFVQDQRNVLIAFLSILVLFFAMASPSASKAGSITQTQPVLQEQPMIQAMTTTTFASDEAATTKVVTVTSTVVESMVSPDVEQPTAKPVVEEEPTSSFLELGNETVLVEDDSEVADDLQESHNSAPVEQLLTSLAEGSHDSETERTSTFGLENLMADSNTEGYEVASQSSYLPAEHADVQTGESDVTGEVLDNTTDKHVQQLMEVVYNEEAPEGSLLKTS